VPPRDPANSEPGKDSSAADIALEVSFLQVRLLAKLHEQMPGASGEDYLKAAQNLAEAFGAVTAASLESLPGPAAAGTRDAAGSMDAAAGTKDAAAGAMDAAAGARDDTAGAQGEAAQAPHIPTPEGLRAPAAESLHGPAEALRASPEMGRTRPPLYRSVEMRRRLDQLVEAHSRYGHPFGLAVFDIEGPGLREATGSAETVRTVVGAALQDSVRLLDDTFRLEEDALCVLAPNQNTVGGVQMAERLLHKLDDLEAVGGLRIGIAAGVVACPDHGTDAERLLERADLALWRARAVGEPVGVGPLQDH
jgi:GGDEF domain-containing protein